MTQGHTPGPWTQRGDIVGALGHRTICRRTAPDSAYKELPMDDGEGYANARLIAAAPLMLEALEACDAAEDDFEIAEALEKARAAIAAAYGENVHA